MKNRLNFFLTQHVLSICNKYKNAAPSLNLTTGFRAHVANIITLPALLFNTCVTNMSQGGWHCSHNPASTYVY